VQIGKFTKGGKFRLNITCLDLLSMYSRHKVWVKSTGEMPYLYGNHVIKAHVARMTENIPQYAAVCVYNLGGIPLGFGVAGRGTMQIKELEPTGVVIFNQADTGEYLRTEN
jgi:60S ribosome subunit biogenesis protein NIP7